MAMKRKSSHAQKNQKRYNGKYTAANSRRGKKDSENRTGVIVTCVCVIALGIAFLAGCLFFLNSEDGVIYEGVRVAGVKIGGMTQQEAKAAVEEAVRDSYGKKDMIVTVLDDKVTIPADCIGKLDVTKAVRAGYQYGRKGTSVQRQEQIALAAAEGVDVDITSCLNIDSAQIKAKLSVLGEKYSSTLVQSTYEVVGKKPSAEDIQKGVNFQKLVVKKGTPEYGLNMDALYKTVLEGYSRNDFSVTGQCGSVQPDPIDLDAILKDHYVAPVDAKLKSNSAEIEDGKVGYGFVVADVKAKIDNAKPGATVEIPFTQLQPGVTKESLMTNLFKDVLATYTAVSDNNDADRNTNLRLACEAIDGTILSPGEYFSYNAALGERTKAKGYKPGPSYSGGKTVYTVGGGICQVSSALYYCAMVADLKIEERTRHAFFPGYVPLGMDATVSWGSLDFCFRNNTKNPILIDATADKNEVTVSLLGIDDKDYYVKMEYDVLKEYPSTTTYQTMEKGNKEGYKDGDYIVEPYKGYDVVTYRCTYEKATDKLIAKEKEATSNYKKRDGIICEITDAPSAPSGGISGSGGGITDSGSLPNQ